MQEKADFTVVMEPNDSGRRIRYGADALHTCFMQDEDGEGQVPAVTFLCSGEPKTVPAEDIESIEVTTGASVCMVCES